MGRGVKWTKEACIEEAKKFNTKSEWAKGSPSSYAACKKYGKEVFDLATKHMKKSKTSEVVDETKEDFSKEDCLKAAKKFESTSDWEENSYDTFVAAKGYGDKFFKICTKHMDKSADSAESEWTKEACLEEAKKFDTRAEWKIMSPESLKAAVLYGREFFNQCISHMKKEDEEYSKEEVLNDSKRFFNKKDWYKASPDIFKYAKKLGEEFLVKCTEHMIEDNWDREAILKEAMKFNSQREWLERSPNSYNTAKKIGESFLSKCSDHMDIDNTAVKRWTKDRVLDEARKYSSVAEWVRKSESSFRSAEIYGEQFLSLCLSHMKD